MTNYQLIIYKCKITTGKITICKMATRKVVVVGMSQSGKSSLLRFLHEYVGVPIPSSLVIGTGDISTTKVSTVYKFTNVVPVNFMFKNNMIPNSILDAFNDNNYSINTNSNTHIVKSNTFNLDVLDTPGLDDTNIDDEQHIIDMLNNIGDMGELTTIIFIVNSRTPYSASFIKYFKYYTEMLSQLSSKFIVVHSHFGIDERVDVQVNEHVNGGSRMEQRVNNFIQATGSDCEHYFINSRCNVSGNYIVPKLKTLDTAVSYSVLTQILLSIFTRSNIPIANIKFKKTVDINNVESLIRTSLNAKLTGYTQGISSLCQVTGNVADNLSAAIKDIVKLDTSIKTIQARLDDIDVCYPEETGFTSISRHWYNGINNKSKTLLATITSEVDISYANIEYWCNDNQYSISKPLKYSDGRKTITCELTTDDYKQDLDLCVVAYSNKNIIYKDEIVKLKQELQSLMTISHDKKLQLQQYKSVIAQPGTLDKIISYIDTIGTTLHKFTSDYYSIETFLSIQPVLEQLKHNPQLVHNMDFSEF